MSDAEAGRFEGRVEAKLENLERLGCQIADKLERHGGRLNKLEQSQAKMWGGAAAIAAVFSSIVSWLSGYFKQ